MSGQVVVFTANDRPHYMARTLDLWSRVRGIGDCRLIFRCESGCPEMAALCGTASDFAGEVTVIVNEERHGVLRNPHTALTTGFAFGDFVILAEDDLTPADDTLEFLAWCDRYRGFTLVVHLGPDGKPHRPKATALLIEHRVLQLDTKNLLYIKDWRSRT